MARTANHELPLIPGDWDWRMCDGGTSHPKMSGRWLYFNVATPCGLIGLHGIPILPAVNTKGNGWSWDGNEEAPTLAPSIKCESCGWHGFIRAGQVVVA